METEGLVHALKEVSSYGIHITTLTTDRHTQIIKYVREQTNIQTSVRYMTRLEKC